MKLKLPLFLFFVSIQLSFAQIKQKYSIYLSFDSSANEMIVSEKKVSDSIWVRTYEFSKDISDENCKDALWINENGEVVKESRDESKLKLEESLILYHYSYRNRIEHLDHIQESSVIYYRDFINSEFKSFNKILKNAEKVFVIDKDEIKSGSSKIKAYQIMF